MNGDITKIKMTRNRDYLISDYGIYDFFEYSDQVSPCKLVATVIDGSFFVCMEKYNMCYHHDLVERISNRYGSFDLCIYACDDIILMWKEENKLSEEEYNSILNILYEIKRYHDSTHRKKEIDISFLDFEFVSYSDSIDYIINKFVSNKNELVKNRVKQMKRVYCG